jgi:ubiquitin C-terminal hydrolase
MGSLGGGHYTASCEVGGGKWFTFNDENCSGEDGPPRVSKHAYVLFYALQ